MRPSQSDSPASCQGCIPSTRWLLASPTQSCREFVGARSIVGSPMKSSWQQETWVTSKLNARSSAIEHNCAISLNSSQKSLHTCDVNTSRSPKFSECSPGCQVSLKTQVPREGSHLGSSDHSIGFHSFAIFPKCHDLLTLNKIKLHK